MNIINILRKITFTFMICLATYAMADDAVDTQQYNVQINGIQMSKESADVLLHHIGEGREVIVAHDNIDNEDILLTSTEKDMNVTIKNDFLTMVSDLYKDALKQNKKAAPDTDKTCASTAINNNEINLCIDKKSKVILGIEIKS